MLRPARYLLSLAMFAGLAGCAPARPPQPVTQAVAGEGTIVSIRTVNSGTSVAPWRAALLAGGSGSDDGDRALLEFIVRADDGAMLSVVQTNAPGFHEGDRVTILRGDRTRLARPGTTSS